MYTSDFDLNAVIDRCIARGVYTQKQFAALSREERLAYIDLVPAENLWFRECWMLARDLAPELFMNKSDRKQAVIDYAESHYHRVTASAFMDIPHGCGCARRYQLVLLAKDKIKAARQKELPEDSKVVSIVPPTTADLRIEEKATKLVLPTVEETPHSRIP
jgi:hypothetical protein